MTHILILLLALALGACSSQSAPPAGPSVQNPSRSMPDQTPDPVATTRPATTTRPAPGATAAGTEVITFGAGCFWCIEAVLQQIEGVTGVVSGYMGGATRNPTYREVCAGTTGHAEVVQVTFDPARVSLDTLLDWFFRLHDPTTLNRQGADEGTQYRSAIFWHTEAQRDAATRFKQALDEKGVFADPIVTEITKASEFFTAEDYHQDYYRQNKSAGYCRAVIRPKLEKLGLEK
jgi:peptide-methionine (S)-S-oxide reductase